MSIQKAFEINSYDEIIEYSNSFDLYAIDSTNIIIAGIPVFEESNLPRIISNKYRLCNINVTENDLEEENLNSLLNKITLILRVNKNGQISAEFLPGDKAVEQYLKANLPLLQQQFKNEGLEYENLSYRQSKKDDEDKQKQQHRENKKENGYEFDK